MTQERRQNTDRNAAPASVRPAWRMPEEAVLPARPGVRAKWLLAAAIILQIAWIAALAAMALFARWRT